MIFRTRFVLPLLCLFAAPVFADLQSYVDKPDQSSRYEVVQEQQMGPADVSVVQLTSQTWENKPWQHWLYILKPKQILHPGKAVLVIVGGSNQAGMPKLPKEAMMIGLACQQLGVPVAVLGQVPNQPLFDNLKEDNLIAHTMTMYLESGNEEQILLMPMVKSAVKAMDCVSELMQKTTGTPIKQFVVSGGSKRGWTTYLTAAVDKRVIAAAPLVIDMLKLPAQMEKQRQVYGKHLSPKIKSYTSRGVLDHLDSERGKKLVQLIDPYAHRKLLTMPKLLLLGTNDPFWTVDAANLYFDDLPGTTYLYYVANAGHGLDLAAMPTLLSFFKASISESQLARFDWKRNDDGSTTVQCKVKPIRLELIQSNNPTMDFREAQWVSKPLAMNADAINIKPDKPVEGYLAYYINATFPSVNQLPYSLSTQIMVLSGQ